MASRYQNIKTKKYPSGKVGYVDVSYPNPTPSSQDYYIITKEGDRLDLIASDFYGDSTLWWVVAMANDLPGDSLFPPLGFQLRVPFNVSDALSAFDSANSNEE